MRLNTAQLSVGHKRPYSIGRKYSIAHPGSECVFACSQKTPSTEDFAPNGLDSSYSSFRGVSALLWLPPTNIIFLGGTAAAAKKLVEQCGGNFLGYLFMIEITVLRGHEQRKHLGDYPLLALVED